MCSVWPLETNWGRVKKALQRLHQVFYDKGNKAHTLLAHKLCEQTCALAPQALCDTHGVLHSHPERITQILCKYFSDLYNDPSIPHLPVKESFYDRVHAYLTCSGVATLPASALQSLIFPITEEEVSETLKLLPESQSPWA